MRIVDPEARVLAKAGRALDPDHRSDGAGPLLILACHGVFDPQVGCIYAEHPEDAAIYESQLLCALRCLDWMRGRDPLLVISGGATKPQRRCSESRSYVEWAQERGVSLPSGICLEEYALTSVENVLFGVHAYVMARGAIPRSLSIVSWEFKRAMFAAAVDALRAWHPAFRDLPSLHYVPVGDILGSERASAAVMEARYVELLSAGVSEYYRDEEVKRLIARRDVYGSRDDAKRFYNGFALPF